jgi:hypothetical protein
MVEYDVRKKVTAGSQCNFELCVSAAIIAPRSNDRFALIADLSTYSPAPDRPRLKLLSF